MPDFGVIVTLGLAAVAFVVWLVRLEGRVNALKDRAAASETIIAEVKANAAAEAKAHRETSDALIRLEEAVKHQTRLIEQHFSGRATPRRTAK